MDISQITQREVINQQSADNINRTRKRLVIALADLEERKQQLERQCESDLQQIMEDRANTLKLFGLEDNKGSNPSV